MSDAADLVIGVLARVPVDDLDAAVPFYRRMSGDAAVRRFEHGDVRLAWVGSFLLIEGGDEAVRSRVATVLVTDVEQVARLVVAAGGEVLEGPSAGPNGPRLVVRHPDGAVVEHVEPADDLR